MKIGETKKIKPISKEEISSPYAGKIPELPKYEPKKEESKITEIDKKKIGLLTRLKEAVKTAFGKLKKDKEEESLKTEKDLGLSSISQTLKTPKQIAREERVEFESARGVVGKLEIDDFYKPKLMTMMTQERDYKFAIEAGVTDKEIEEFVKLRKDLGFEKEKPEIFSKVETLETKLETAEDQIFKKLDNAGIVFDKDDFNEFIGRVSEAFERKESGESNFDKIYQSVEKSANLQEQIVGLKENLKNVKTDKEKKKLEKEILKLETNLSKEKEALQSNIWKEDSQISKRKQNNQTKMSNLITKYEEAAEITKRLDEITKNFTEQINEVQRENDLLEEERKQIKVEKIKLGLELEPEIKTIEEGIQKLIPDTAQSKNDLKDNLEKLKDYINKNPDADVASISEYSKGFEWKNNEDADFFNLRVRTNFGKDLGIERTNKDKLDNISYLVNKKIEETDTDF